MADLMKFPDTVEEFMEQCKVTDTDHVYSNGTDYVPIFRMKQWFEHLQPKTIVCGMTMKQISTLHYILGRLEGLAEGLEQNQQQYLLDTCEILDELLREEIKE